MWKNRLIVTLYIVTCLLAVLCFAMWFQFYNSTSAKVQPTAVVSEPEQDAESVVQQDYVGEDTTPTDGYSEVTAIDSDVVYTGSYAISEEAFDVALISALNSEGHKVKSAVLEILQRRAADTGANPEIYRPADPLVEEVSAHKVYRISGGGNILRIHFSDVTGIVACLE